MITGIHAATVPVSDVDRALAFYVDVLGMEKRIDHTFDFGRFVTVAPFGSTTELALSEPAFRTPRFAEPGGETGINLLAPDVNELYADLQAKGVTFPSPPERMSWGGLGVLLADPDGNTFYVLERGG